MGTWMIPTKPNGIIFMLNKDAKKVFLLHLVFMLLRKRNFFNFVQLEEQVQPIRLNDEMSGNFVVSRIFTGDLHFVA
jgi:hypothetical protein